jgi:hypothetical protein
MIDISDIIEDLAEADIASSYLRDLADAKPGDQILPINLAAVLRRRTDLEHRMSALLSVVQVDLIAFEIRRDDGGEAAAAPAASCVVLFQRLLTAAFDAVRTGTPKRLYDPSPENVELSTLSFSPPPDGSHSINLTIANERLLAIDTDLDQAITLVLELLALRPKTLIRELAQRVGVATVAAAHALAAHAAAHDLSVSVAWRKRDREHRQASISHSDAQAFAAAVEAINDDRIESIDRECELLAIDEIAGSFRIACADNETISGELVSGFASGGQWTTHRWYKAHLVRAVRLRYASGEEIVRWSLRGLDAET